MNDEAINIPLLLALQRQQYPLLIATLAFQARSHNDERKVGTLAFQTGVRKLWKAAKPPNNDG